MISWWLHSVFILMTEGAAVARLKLSTDVVRLKSVLQCVILCTLVHLTCIVIPLLYHCFRSWPRCAIIRSVRSRGLCKHRRRRRHFGRVLKSRLSIHHSLQFPTLTSLPPCLQPASEALIYHRAVKRNQYVEQLSWKQR